MTQYLTILMLLFIEYYCAYLNSSYVVLICGFVGSFALSWGWIIVLQVSAFFLCTVLN